MDFATNYDELSEIVSRNIPLARSAEEFLSILKSSNTPEYLKDSVSILNRASSEELLDFSRTLEFKDGMLGHANYNSIGAHLHNEEEVLKIWEIFGIGSVMASGTVDYFCKLGHLDEPKKCVKNKGSFCGSLICQN
ncbi:hypothetical protein [Stappia sp. MMSF_3263]|uniref:hypothetical protein n=1 Tax=Stappia sp. MMSF_3263 TaxID=3046693 RepID=UPI00273D028E|nr:hypothetical protein [Stappia sp. MMSF_3263]